MSDGTNEIERQYVLPGPEPTLPQSAGGFSLDGGEERTIRDEYLDTASRSLAEHGVILRVREQNGVRLATYKDQGQRDASGTRTREEIEAPLGDDREGHPAFTAARRYADGPLQVIGVLHNERSAHVYRRGDDAVEVVVDRLTYPDASCELRLEIEGDAASVATVGDALEGQLPGLVPAQTSKGAELVRRMGSSTRPSAAAVARRCRRSLILHGTQADRPRAVLEALAREAAPDLEPDSYGEGTLLAELEREVADLLGHEAAVFMPSGTMAQQIALRLHAERRGRVSVAFHPRCHLERHERSAYRVLHDLRGVHVGDPDRLLTLGDLEAVREPLAALVLELPQRDLGGRLPPFEDVLAQTAFARQQGAAAHLDGARLWECAPFYGRSYAELCAPFDTVYVSFYKRLGGLAGCALAGPEDLIAESRVWQQRHGGRLISLYPYALSARAALRDRLPRMARYQEHAVAIADALRDLPDVELVPDPPQAAMMHVLLRRPADALVEAALAVAIETSVFLFGRMQPTTSPLWHRFELAVGDATLELEPAEVRDLLRQVMERAAAGT